MAFEVDYQIYKILTKEIHSKEKHLHDYGC